MSGAIDVAELRGALAALGLTSDNTGAQKILTAYDRDMNGQLEMAEFRDLVLAIRRFQVRGLEPAPTGAGAPPPPGPVGSQRIRDQVAPDPANAAYANRLISGEEVDAAFRRFDFDRSGDIDITECALGAESSNASQHAR